MLLKNKNAVIDGAGGSIVQEVAQAFAREGTRVFLVGRNESACNAVLDRLFRAAL